MKIRVATSADIDTLRALEQQVVAAERPFNEAIKAVDAIYYDLDAMLSDTNTHLIVGEKDSQIVATGYAQIRPSKAQLVHEHHGYLGFMLVLPEYRGQGFNQQVMEHLIEWCKGQNINDFYLDVYSANEAAIRAYEKAGFTPCLLEMKLHL